MKQLFTLISLFLTVFLYGQEFLMSDTTINTCSGTFYDTGGAAGDYGVDEDITMTICSDLTNAEIEVLFTNFDTESGYDKISIYDGIGTSGTLLVSNASGTTLLNTSFISQGSGCLTFIFTSDASVTYSGWEAQISCRFPCQEFDASISTNIPVFSGDTIRTCSYDTLELSVTTDYLNNDINYHQADTTSMFYWDFGDGTDMSGIGLTTVNHMYNGYLNNIELKIKDVNDCYCLDTINLVVKSSKTPEFDNVEINDTICLDETVDFSGYVQTQNLSYQFPLVFNDTTFLPDGNGSTVYIPFSYNQFSDDEILTDSLQIESICVDLEFSYAGDLIIALECPNGQQMTLFDGFDNSNISNEYIGEPTYYSVNMGTPYTYCWSPTSTNGTMEEVGINPPTYSYLDNDSNQITNHEYIPGGEYATSGNWSDLIGCPLNGDWKFLFIDNFPNDDGYLFSWQINWNIDLIDTMPEYTITYDENLYNWVGDSIISQNNGVGSAIPSNTGLQDYTFSVVDNFGCEYDTSLQVYVNDCSFIYNYTEENEFSLYPNPSIESITVEFTNNKLKENNISIIDVRGNIIKTINTSKNIELIDVSTLEKGVYFIKVGDKLERFVKE